MDRHPATTQPTRIRFIVISLVEQKVYTQRSRETRALREVGLPSEACVPATGVFLASNRPPASGKVDPWAVFSRPFISRLERRTRIAGLATLLGVSCALPGCVSAPQRDYD